MELRQSPQWGKYLESFGWTTEIVDGCVMRIRQLGPLGSIIKIQRPDSLPIKKIERVAKKCRALFVKIEPIDNSQSSILNSQFYKLDAWPLTPPRTAFIDLTKTEAELLKSFSKDTRQRLKKIRNSKIEIRSFSFEFPAKGENILRNFYEIWQETGKRGRFYVPSYKELMSLATAFGENALLLLAYSGDVESDQTAPLAGCLLLFFDGVAYYHHAASTKEGREVEAPYSVLWEAIKEAKRRGGQKLDLEGIFDPRFPSMFKKWLLFSTFKLKWGGEVVEYPGSFIKVRNLLLRLLFRLAK